MRNVAFARLVLAFRCVPAPSLRLSENLGAMVAAAELKGLRTTTCRLCVALSAFVSLAGLTKALAGSDGLADLTLTFKLQVIKQVLLTHLLQHLAGCCCCPLLPHAACSSAQEGQQLIITSMRHNKRV